MKTKIFLMTLFVVTVSSAQVRNFKGAPNTKQQQQQTVVPKTISANNTDGDDKKFTLGFGAGVNYSTIFDENIPSTVTVTSRFGFRGGLTANYFFTPIVGLKSGLFYSRIGATYETSTNTENMNIDQLQIPIMANIRVGNGADKTYLGFGVIYGMVQDAMLGDNDFNNYYAKTDIQACIDLDVHYSGGIIGSGGLFYSMSSIVDPNISVGSENNFGMFLGLSYNFL